MHKSVLLTGVTGQDGAYLAENVSKKGYIVHGIKRSVSLINTDCIDHFQQDLQESNRHLIHNYGDLTHSRNLRRNKQEVKAGQKYPEDIKTKIAPSPFSPDKQKAIINAESAYCRPSEVDMHTGDSSKARAKLARALKYDLQALNTDLMKSDISLSKKTGTSIKEVNGLLIFLSNKNISYINPAKLRAGIFR